MGPAQVVLATVALLLPTAPNTPANAARYIVVLHPSAGDPEAVAHHQVGAGDRIRSVYRSALSGYAADLTPAAAARLRHDRRVASLTPTRQVRAAVTVPHGIERVRAHLSTTAAIDGDPAPDLDVNVAVLDSGIDPDHPDLNVVGGKNCAAGRGFDDRLGHGTHAAGIVGARDDGVGVVGVAPGVRLWAVRVLDGRGHATTEELLCGIDWVTSTRTDSDPTNDIAVANVSLGGDGVDDGACGARADDPLHAAICRSVAAGVTYVVAAGNDASDASTSTPAAYDEVITVSALADSDGRPGGLGPALRCRPDEDDDGFASFSNYGADVDLVAPGVCVVSTLPSRSPGDANYGVLSGTSFSAPHVAGAAALYLATHPSAQPAQVRHALVTAGSYDWDARRDPDGIKEPLLDVAGL